MKTMYSFRPYQTILLLGIFLMLILIGCSHEEEIKPQGETEMRNLSVFKTRESEARYMAAYDAILARWPVPYEELNVPTRFGTTHIVASGSRNTKTLILIHCGFGSSMAWLLNISELSKHYHIYAVDVIGEPNRSIPVHPIRNRDEFAQWLSDVFDGLKIKSAFIVGNSYGGFLTLNQAAHTPERIEKVVLISPAATFAQIWPMYFRLPYFTLISKIYGKERFEAKVWEWILQGIAVDKNWKDLMTMAMVYGKFINIVLPIVFKREELKRVHQPVLLLIGDKEVIYNPEKTLKKAKRVLPHLRGELLPNANHLGALSNPDYVNRRIINFLQEESK